MASSTLPRAWRWTARTTSWWRTGATPGQAAILLLRKTPTISLNVNFMAFSFYPVKILTITLTLFAGSKSIVNTVKTVLMSLVTQDPGVWPVRVIPLLCEHPGLPAVRPPGPGPDTRGEHRGGGQRQPLHQDIQVSPVRTGCTVKHGQILSLTQLFKYFDNSSQIKYSEFLGEAGVIMANHDALILCVVFDYGENSWKFVRKIT